MYDKAVAIISDIMTAVSNCQLYSAQHVAVGEFTQKALWGMKDTLEKEDLSFMVLGGTMLCNDTKLSSKSLHVGNLVKKLRRKGVEKVVISKGATKAELLDLVAVLASPTATPKGSEHIHVGIVEVRSSSEKGVDLKSLVDEQTGKIQDIHHEFSKRGKLDMVGLEDVVISFISTLKEESNILKLASPVKSYSEYTFAHTTNVTILSLFQAESLGFKGDILHEVGLAGLLHDVGKMFVPIEVLEKPGKLDNDEWVIMKKHTEFGARYLASRQDVPKLAIIAAYEHHLKYDGTGYPETKRRGRKQHLISQIVSVADFFDALRTDRPYRKSLEVPVIVGFMQEATGKDFNPALVNHFIGSLKEQSIYKEVPKPEGAGGDAK